MDLGCGDGLIGFGALARLGRDGRVVFNDVSADLLDHCRRIATDLDELDRCRFHLPSGAPSPRRHACSARPAGCAPRSRARRCSTSTSATRSRGPSRPASGRSTSPSTRPGPGWRPHPRPRLGHPPRHGRQPPGAHFGRLIDTALTAPEAEQVEAGTTTVRSAHARLRATL